MKMPFLSPPSLKEICKSFLVKKGIARIDLPSTLAEEVEELEGRIKSIFTGTFHRLENSSVITMTVAWTQGQWEITMKNQETLVIKSGVENTLGKPGGELFLLPGRAVSIFDFKLDLTSNLLSFEGMCSSIENPHGRLLKIVVYFSESYLEMCTQVMASEGIKREVEGEIFWKDIIFTEVYGISYSDDMAVTLMMELENNYPDYPDNLPTEESVDHIDEELEQGAEDVENSVDPGESSHDLHATNPVMGDEDEDTIEGEEEDLDTSGEIINDGTYADIIIFLGFKFRSQVNAPCYQHSG